MHKITDETRQIVHRMAGLGMRQTEIANVLDISQDTLARRYRRELDAGVTGANTKIANRLFEIAMNGEDRVAITALIFWLKCRAGWKQAPEVAVEVNVAQQVNGSERPARTKGELETFARQWERLRVTAPPEGELVEG